MFCVQDLQWIQMGDHRQREQHLWYRVCGVSCCLSSYSLFFEGNRGHLVSSRACELPCADSITYDYNDTHGVWQLDPDVVVYASKEFVFGPSIWLQEDGEEKMDEDEEVFLLDVDAVRGTLKQVIFSIWT